MPDLDTALLRSFIVLAETRSFSKTGEQVGRSQSAISAQIARLEGLVGQPLVLRDTRNVALTRAGEELLSQAQRLLVQTDDLFSRFGASALSGTVRFASPEDFASTYLPGVLAAFSSAHERVELQVGCDLTLRLIAQFEAGEHDLIIIKQDPQALHAGAVPLWRERLVWVAAETLAAPFAALLRPARQKPSAAHRPLPLVLSPAPCVYRGRAIRALDEAAVAWTAVYSSPSLAGTLAAVRAGLGVSVMPLSLMRRGLETQGLVTLSTEAGWPALGETEICLLGRTRPSAAASALAQFIRTHAQPSV